jgi:hypothetical protein
VYDFNGIATPVIVPARPANVRNAQAANTH